MVQIEEEGSESANVSDWRTDQFDGAWVSGSTVSAAGGFPKHSIQVFVPAAGNVAEEKVLVPAPVFDSFSQSPQLFRVILARCKSNKCGPLGLLPL